MNFIENALGYKHQWWRYLLNLVLCLIFANILALVGFIACMICGISMNDMISIVNSQNGYYVLTTFALMTLAFYLSFKCTHRGKLSLLIKGDQPFSLKSFITVFGITAVVLAIITAVEMVIQGNYHFALQAKDLPLLLILFPLVALQTLLEEMVFRAYIPQGLSLFIKNKWVCVVVAAFLFAALHAINQPVKEGGSIFLITYFVIGLALGFIALLDNGIEKAWAVHFANNLVAMFFIVDKKPELTGMPSLFQFNGIDAPNYWDIIGTSIVFIAIFACMYKLYKWNLTAVKE